MHLQPGQGMVHHVLGTAFYTPVSIFTLGAIVERGIVRIESSAETGRHWILRVDDHGSDKCGRPVSAMVQDIRQIGEIRSQRLSHVAHMVVLGIRTGEDVRVRRRGQGHLCVGTRKDHALSCQGIEIRSQAAGRAQKTHAIGTSRIQRDENNVGPRGNSRGWGGSCPGALSHQHQKRQPPKKPHRT